MSRCMYLNPIISKTTILNWINLDSIKQTFDVLKFNDIENKNNKELLILIDDESIFLRVLITNKPPSSSMFNQRVRYVLLVSSDFETFTFAKSEYSPTGAIKFPKFKFTKKDIINDGSVAITKLRNALKFNNHIIFENLFDMKEVVSKFYSIYKIKLRELENSIIGIDNFEDRKHYSEILFYRIIFCYFIQTKKFLSNEDAYLKKKFNNVENKNDNFYSDFLCPLFFDVLNTKNRKKQLEYSEFDEIPFLNGGLFRMHHIEKKYAIKIENPIFHNILDFLSRWIWYTDEDINVREGGINPDILGNIFEKTINDKRNKGAYYTPVDLTRFIIGETIASYCLDKINKKFSKTYSKLSDIKSIDKNQHELEYLYFDIIKNITILDNACGSGEFLLSALNMLLEVYQESWKKIAKFDSNNIKIEYQLINEFQSIDYYFKKRIISHNLFGIDFEDGAIEICKLRLWLSLVSQMSKEDAEPLPNIDYNIMIGNSLLGYIKLNTGQTSLSGSSAQNIIDEIEDLKEKFRLEFDPINADDIKIQIDEKIKTINTDLNKALVTDTLSLLNSKKRKTKTALLDQIETFKTFHWRLHFDKILKNGGFDIIVGNPPYVQTSKIDYPVDSFKTISCGNSYAYFFETSLNLLKPDGRLGYIVPVSSISTKRMSTLHNLLVNNCSELKISSYDDPPEKIFEGARHNRSAIILCKRNSNVDNKCTIYTTGYKEYNTEERPTLFKNIKYTESTEFFKEGSIPKIANEIEKSIMRKIKNKPVLKAYLEKNHKKIEKKYEVWYHNAPQFWIRAMTFNPEFIRNNVITNSEHNKPIYVGNELLQNLIVMIMNSSTFYWFFIKISNGRDLYLSTIENFCVDVTKFNMNHNEKFKKIVSELMENYKEKSVLEKTMRKKTKTVVEYRKFFPRHAKHIIDKIDDLFADHYKFTKTELEYIKTFDESYRLGTLINDGGPSSTK